MQILLIIILILSVIAVIISIVGLVKNKTDNNSSEIIKSINSIPETTQRQNGELEKSVLQMLGEMQKNNTKDMGEMQVNVGKQIQENFTSLNETLIKRINELNDKVRGTLDENFKTTNQTFQDVIKRLAAIDQAQQKIDGLSTEIVSLQSILTDKKTRGIFGEINLNIILSNVFGESNKGPDKIWDTQHTMSNGTIADSIVRAPEPIGLICIDSKFPLENYKKMIDKELSESDRTIAEKQFTVDVKKHIDAIAAKYIIEGETAAQAIMFLPAEAIFAEIHAYHEDILKYAYAKNVWITSPTTLMSTMSTILMIVKNMERDKYAQSIHENLNKLSKDFTLYKNRWDNLSKHMDTVSKDVKEINITTNKISSKFEQINNVEMLLPEENQVVVTQEEFVEEDSGQDD